AAESRRSATTGAVPGERAVHDAHSERAATHVDRTAEPGAVSAARHVPGKGAGSHVESQIASPDIDGATEPRASVAAVLVADEARARDAERFCSAAAVVDGSKPGAAACAPAASAYQVVAECTVGNRQRGGAGSRVIDHPEAGAT